MQKIKCGYCNWFIANRCQNILEHECFKDYDENADALNIDENNVATIGTNIVTLHISFYIM